MSLAHLGSGSSSAQPSTIWVIDSDFVHVIASSNNNWIRFRVFMNTWVAVTAFTLKSRYYVALGLVLNPSIVCVNLSWMR